MFIKVRTLFLHFFLFKLIFFIFLDLLSLQYEQGYALQDIITKIHDEIFKISFSTKIRIEILEKLAEIEYQLSAGGSEKVQVAAFVAAFQAARDAQGAQ